MIALKQETDLRRSVLESPSIYIIKQEEWNDGYMQA